MSGNLGRMRPSSPEVPLTYIVGLQCSNQSLTERTRSEKKMSLYTTVAGVKYRQLHRHSPLAVPHRPFSGCSYLRGVLETGAKDRRRNAARVRESSTISSSRQQESGTDMQTWYSCQILTAMRARFSLQRRIDRRTEVYVVRSRVRVRIRVVAFLVVF